MHCIQLPRAFVEEEGTDIIPWHFRMGTTANISQFDTADTLRTYARWQGTFKRYVLLLLKVPPRLNTINIPVPRLDCRFQTESPNVVHMTIKPQEVVDEEDAKTGKGGSRNHGDDEPHARCRCVILWSSSPLASKWRRLSETVRWSPTYGCRSSLRVGINLKEERIIDLIGIVPFQIWTEMAIGWGELALRTRE